MLGSLFSMQLFIRMNRHAIAMMFVRCVCLARGCIVIIWYTLAQI